MAPGEGASIFNPTAVPFTALSVGFAGPGSMLGFSGPGCSLASRQIADPGNYVNIMGSLPADGAVVDKFNPVTDQNEVKRCHASRKVHERREQKLPATE